MSNRIRCFAIGTPIMKFIDGEIRIVEVEDLNLGDTLLGSDGNPTKIIKLYNGYGKLYKIEQENGLCYIVNNFYKIALSYIDGKKIQLSVGNYQKLHKSEKLKLFGYKTNIDFPKKEILHGDPYDFGLSIDRDNQVAIHPSYKYNTKEVKLEILAGLIDSFGSLENSDIYQLVATNKELADDIIFISRSLGLRTFVNLTTSKDLGNVTHDEFTISIIDEGHIDIPIRNILMKCISDPKNYKPYLTKILVSDCFESDFIGFELDNNGEFVSTDFTVLTSS